MLVRCRISWEIIPDLCAFSFVGERSKNIGCIHCSRRHFHVPGICIPFTGCNSSICSTLLQRSWRCWEYFDSKYLTVFSSQVSCKSARWKASGSHGQCILASRREQMWSKCLTKAFVTRRNRSNRSIPKVWSQTLLIFRPCSVFHCMYFRIVRFWWGVYSISVLVDNSPKFHVKVRWLSTMSYSDDGKVVKATLRSRMLISGCNVRKWIAPLWVWPFLSHA